MCGESMTAASIDEFGDAFLAHCKAVHSDVPYPDDAVRSVGQSMARMTGSAERLESIGTVTVEPVTPERIDDWLDLFDHDLFVDVPHNGACYCLEAHEVEPGQPLPPFGDWRSRRATMAQRFRDGTTFGYLAYVDGRPAAWVNASMRGDYTLHRRNDGADASTAAIACFAVAPPYRNHGLSKTLLDAVLAGAPDRGASTVEAYPVLEVQPGATAFRGPREIYDAAGFTEVKVRQRDVVVRRRV